MQPTPSHPGFAATGPPTSSFAYTVEVKAHPISSKDNPAFKALRATLKAGGEGRTHTLILGPKLIEAWWESRESPAAARFRPEGWVRLEDAADHKLEASLRLPTLVLPEARMKELTDMGSVPTLALHVSLGPEPGTAVGPRALGAWGVQDPGNLGALLRAAVAFGFTDALLGPGCADPFAPKALRGAMGAAFVLPIRRREQLREGGHQVWALDGGPESVALPEADLREPLCLWVGNEGHGWQGVALPADVRKLAIPIQGVESLNASVAAGIACYEVARRLG